MSTVDVRNYVYHTEGFGYMRILHTYRVMALAVLAALVVLAVPVAVMAEDKVWTSGRHGLNEHVIPEIDPTVEIINGKVSEVTPSGIYMDGVFVNLIGAEIIDDKYRPAEIKDLYIGLEVQVFKRYGGAYKVLCFNMSRARNTVPDPARLEQAVDPAAAGSKKK